MAWQRQLRAKASNEFKKLRNYVRLQQRWWLRKHQEFQPLFLLATYRSGSNLLVDYLNSLDIECFYEILNSAMPIAPIGERYSKRRAANHIRMSLQCLESPVRGCKLMLDQLHHAQLTPTDLLRDYPTARFTVLYRQSLAEQFLSNRTARVTQQWMLRPGARPRHVVLHVDREDLLEFCERTKNYYKSLLESPDLEGRTVLLSYEELTANPCHWLCEQICPQVGQRPGKPPCTMLRKQNSKPLDQRVENFSEVGDLLTSDICRQHYVLPGQALPAAEMRPAA
jgi:LPS sulfotransferase NodH